MREEATGSGFAFERQRFRNWPTRCRSQFRSVTSLHGTSKWNKIEHRLFSFISKNGRGKPLISHAVIVKLITATRTKTGLKVKTRLDMNSNPGGIKVRKADHRRQEMFRFNSWQLELHDLTHDGKHSHIVDNCFVTGP